MKWNRAIVLSTSAFSCGVGLYFYNKEPSFGVKQNSQYRLEQVQVLIRHGARTPLGKLSDDLLNIPEAVWKEERFGGTLAGTDINLKCLLSSSGKECSIDDSQIEKRYLKNGPLKGGMLHGQLTMVGQQQSFAVGKWLCREYIVKHQFLSPTYSKDELFVRSSFMKRTLFTARCVVAGLYGMDNIHEPVEIVTNEGSNETIYPNFMFCKNLSNWLVEIKKNMRQLPGHQEDMSKFQEMLKMDKNTTTPTHAIEIVDLVHSREVHGLHIPKEMLERKELIEQRACELQYHILEGKDRLNGLRISVGSLLNDICNSIEKPNEKKSNHSPKMSLYSCHDTTLLGILGTLEVNYKGWPRYASFLSLELYKDMDGKRYVRVLFNGDELKLEDSTSYMPIERFLSQVQKYRVANWDNACGNKEDFKGPTLL